MHLLIVGHSFVRRIADNVSLRRNFVNSLTIRYSTVSFRGQGGMTVDRLHRLIPDIAMMQPDVVVVDIGTNDLSGDGVDAAVLGLRIAGLVNDIRNLPSVRVVVILPIVARMVRCRYRTRPDFEQARHRCNDAVRTAVRSRSGVYVWRHRCLHHGERYYHNDGVHLNQAGCRLYALSIRRAALFVRNRC